jgi:Fe-Mn family superoxide dismutase
MSMNRRDAVRTLTLAAAAATLVPRDAARAQTAAAAAPTGPFKLDPLPYAPEALEPHLDAQTMTIHHGKHHATYVAKLNEAVAGKPDLASRSVEDLVKNLATLPEDIRTAVRNHGGGHANHTLFWNTLSPKGREPSAKLADALKAAFGDRAGFQEKLTKAAMGVFGSGWAWLSLDASRKLLIESTPNQDSPLTLGHTPLFGIDVWEHAYYLKYQNRRADYVAAIFHVIDWDAVSRRFEQA